MSTVFSWSRAPHWAVAKGENGTCEAWIGNDGYNFQPRQSGLENSFNSHYTRESFTILESRPLTRIAAHEFLERGVKHMRDRAVQRDSDASERSMARAVAALNAQEGTNLTEAQGWRFMIHLKYARAVNGMFVADDYEDMAGEAAQ